MLQPRRLREGKAMAEKHCLLILRLEGALQSWGESSKWDTREGADFPTKSGIIGLLGCAMGLERGDPLLAEMSDAVRIAVRADRGGVRMIDFQTVTGSPLRNAEGKPKSTGNTIISNRTYLQDACFTVVLETDPVWKEKILAALKEPKWCMYLGRKNCVPSRPILEREEVAFFDLEEAIRCYPPSERADVGMVFETEKESSARASYTRPDRLLPGGRRYASRRVWRGITKEEPNVSV